MSSLVIHFVLLLILFLIVTVPLTIVVDKYTKKVRQFWDDLMGD